MITSKLEIQCRRVIHAFLLQPRSRKYASQSFPSRQISQVVQLANWDLETFRLKAFNAQTPAKLPFTRSQVPPACWKWFIHTNDKAGSSRHSASTSVATDGSLDSDADLEIDIKDAAAVAVGDDHGASLQVSYLRKPFWSEHESLMVPLELTATVVPNEPPRFIRSIAPLEFLLSYLDSQHNRHCEQQQQQQHDEKGHANIDAVTPETQSIYLAQHPLPSLPVSLQSDLPTPDLVLHAGRGDIYDSSLWLGSSSTSYTPLHRDPNPNILLQLAGRKVVRLLPPTVGDAVFEFVRNSLSSSSSSSSSHPLIRGEEMMVGPERELLHRLIWEITETETDDVKVVNHQYTRDLVTTYMTEAHLGLGEALFIPKGWWHSVRGGSMGGSGKEEALKGRKGVTASANWWFR